MLAHNVQHLGTHFFLPQDAPMDCMCDGKLEV
jgi:hypothetical protein